MNTNHNACLEQLKTLKLESTLQTQILDFNQLFFILDVKLIFYIDNALETETEAKNNLLVKVI